MNLVINQETNGIDHSFNFSTEECKGLSKAIWEWYEVLSKEVGSIIKTFTVEPARGGYVSLQIVLCWNTVTHFHDIEIPLRIDKIFEKILNNLIYSALSEWIETSGKTGSYLNPLLTQLPLEG